MDVGPQEPRDDLANNKCIIMIEHSIGQLVLCAEAEVVLEYVLDDQEIPIREPTKDINDNRVNYALCYFLQFDILKGNLLAHL